MCQLLRYNVVVVVVDVVDVVVVVVAAAAGFVAVADLIFFVIFKAEYIVQERLTITLTVII